MASAATRSSAVWSAADAAPVSRKRCWKRLRADRAGSTGRWSADRLDQGLVARLRGPPAEAARFWFTRIWARIRASADLAGHRFCPAW